MRAKRDLFIKGPLILQGNIEGTSLLFQSKNDKYKLFKGLLISLIIDL